MDSGCQRIQPIQSLAALDRRGTLTTPPPDQSSLSSSSSSPPPSSPPPLPLSRLTPSPPLLDLQEQVCASPSSSCLPPQPFSSSTSSSSSSTPRLSTETVKSALSDHTVHFLSVISETRASFESKQREFNEKYIYLFTQNKELTKLVEIERSKAVEVEIRLEKLNEENMISATTIERLTNETCSLKDNVSSLRSELSSMSSEHDVLAIRYMALSASHASTQSELTALRQQCDEYERSMRTESDRFKLVEEENRRLQAHIQELEHERSAVKAANNEQPTSMSETIDELRSRVESVSNERSDLEKLVESLKSQLSIAKQKNIKHQYLNKYINIVTEKNNPPPPTNNNNNNTDNNSNNNNNNNNNNNHLKQEEKEESLPALKNSSLEEIEIPILLTNTSKGRIATHNTQHHRQHHHHHHHHHVHHPRHHQHQDDDDHDHDENGDNDDGHDKKQQQQQQHHHHKTSSLSSSTSIPVSSITSQLRSNVSRIHALLVKRASLLRAFLECQEQQRQRQQQQQGGIHNTSDSTSTTSSTTNTCGEDLEKIVEAQNEMIVEDVDVIQKLKMERLLHRYSTLTGVKCLLLTGSNTENEKAASVQLLDDHNNENEKKEADEGVVAMLLRVGESLVEKAFSRKESKDSASKRIARTCA